MENEVLQDRSENQSTLLPNAWIDRLFARFAAAYGTEKFAAIWRGQALDEVKAVWAVELGKFSGLEIRAALEALPRRHATWPPTLFEFIELCRPRSIESRRRRITMRRATYARRDGKPGSGRSGDLLGRWTPRARRKPDLADPGTVDAGAGGAAGRSEPAGDPGDSAAVARATTTDPDWRASGTRPDRRRGRQSRQERSAGVGAEDSRAQGAQRSDAIGLRLAHGIGGEKMTLDYELGGSGGTRSWSASRSWPGWC